jgi:outer membrane receptor protein involved in Fe transport
METQLNWPSTKWLRQIRRVCCDPWQSNALSKMAKILVARLVRRITHAPENISALKQAWPCLYPRKTFQQEKRMSKPACERVCKPKVIAIAISVILAHHTTHAQQQAASSPKAEEQKVEKVEVTGSRLPALNVEGASPVTVIDAATIKVDGVRSVENLLNNLPQVFADQGGTISNGSSGTATVNLRGQGTNRTLVLVNGRRLPSGSPRAGASAADLNQVPAPLIKRVEVLTGGAAAVYGSDAVAGVVNFIMNNRFEGVQVEFNQSFYNHSQQNPQGIADVVNGRAATNPAQFAIPGDKSADGKIYDANILMGSNFANGKGNATIFFSYKKEDALLQSERDFSSCSTGSTANAFTCGGSSTSFPGRFLNLNNNVSYTVANAQGGVRTFNATLDQYNFAPTNFYQRPSERYGFNAAANYDIYSNLNLYSEFSFHDDRTVAQIAPSGLFFGNVTFNINFENPLLSQAWRTALGLSKPGDVTPVFLGRRNVEGGGRQDDIRHTSFRTVIGAKGELAGAWNYDVSMQTGKVIYQETYKNEFSFARARNAIDVVSGPGGVPTCRSVLNGSDVNCVPYNLWTLGGVTPEALGYISTPGFQKGSTEQTIAGGNISGDLSAYGWKIPGAKSGISVSIGAEQRTEKLQLDTDTAFTTGDLAGQGGPTISIAGKYTVKDIFGEMRVPILEGAPMAHLLSVNGSVRHSDYSTGNKTDSYGVGIEFAPIQQVRTRASFQQAVRAANIHELFAAQGNGLFNMPSDPCAGATPTASLAACQRTGVTAAQYGRIIDSPAGQYNALGGGNPNLKPEKSKSYTVGVVLEPIPNLTASIDYFDIQIKDVISVLPPAITLQRCLTSGEFCNLIQRDIIGSLWAQPSGRIIATNANIAQGGTSGIDFGANYAAKLGNGMGSYSITFNATLLQRNDFEPVLGGGTFDCKGFHGANCGVPSPKWRHKLRGSWSTPWNVDLALTWRHIDKVANEGTSSNPLLTAAINPIDREFPKQDYFDLAASWSATKNLTVRGGINNLFDKDPPIANSNTLAATFGNGNTYPQVYDALGRRVFLNATYKF